MCIIHTRKLGRSKSCKKTQLVLDKISPGLKFNDRKMQNVETTVIKGSTIMVKVVDKLVLQKNYIDDLKSANQDRFKDKYNDSLTLLHVGHTY